MTLATLVTRIALVTGTLLGVSALSIVGPARLRTMVRTLRPRLRAVFPYIVLLGAVLLVNNLARDVVPEISWAIGLNLTGAIYALEGTFVGSVQSVAFPALTAFLSFVYIYGYVLLLTFPLVAYLALDDLDHFRQTCLAFAFNYAIGLVLYTLFIAYGPRNMLPGIVESLMYTNWPESQLLTSQINTNTNVFPSLHTSLSVSVVLLAVQTRRRYPAWLYLATALAACVIFSTMYLGIHWGMDVVAGAILGTGSVLGAQRVDVVAAIQRRTGGRIANRSRALWKQLR